MHTNPPAWPGTPDLAVPLQGYIPEVGVALGDSFDVMLSGEGAAELSVVRLIHGDPNPEGPGYRHELPEAAAVRALSLTPQLLDIGSHVEIAHASTLNPGGSFTLALWIHPTRLTGGWQTLAAKWGPRDAAYGLFCAGHGTLAGAVSHDGQCVDWCAGRRFVDPDEWQFVALIYDATTGELTVHQYSERSETVLEMSTEIKPVGSTKRVSTGPLHASRAPLLFGAMGDHERGHWAHFNGKLAGPVLIGEACDAAVLEGIRNGDEHALPASVLGAWDFSRGVSSASVIDMSGHGHDGRAVNAPARAVTGPRWLGTSASLYSDNPSAYDAIHLHDDDLDDANWAPTCSVSVPVDAPPGIYCARVTCGTDVLTIPVVASSPRPRADVAVLLPTLTWQAYSSNRAPYSFTEDGVIDASLCLYDTHSDGSAVLYCTRRKPTRSGNPSAGIRPWGAHTLPANLYLIDWLEHSGIAYDALIDQHLHERGAAAIEPYRCVMLGSHAEYWTAQMLDALEGYLKQGGRVMSLSGNALYWVTSLVSERPWIMEVRKSGDGEYEDYFARLRAGEMQHSSTGEVGGLWSRRGRPARRVLGVEHSANIFTDAKGRWGFKRTAESYGARFAFVFDGVADEIIGDFGLNLGSASGYEMDSVLEWPWSDDWRPTVLARAAHETFIPPMRMPVPCVSDIALTTSPRGAAVFAAGSVTWTGSLSHNAYVNNVARITENVLRHFLAVPPGEPVTSSAEPAS